MKIYSNELGYMTKMAPCPYMVKTFKIHLLQNQWTDGLGTREHQVPEYYQDYSNDDLQLTLTFFMARSVMEKW